ncbi:MAG: hypothetical protein PVJ38_01720 [Candidatus Bathyarchaeota archaeon]
MVFEPSRVNPDGYSEHVTGEFITLGTKFKSLLFDATAPDLTVGAVFTTTSFAFFHHPVSA